MTDDINETHPNAADVGQFFKDSDLRSWKKKFGDIACRFPPTRAGFSMLAHDPEFLATFPPGTVVDPEQGTITIPGYGVVEIVVAIRGAE